MSTAVWLRARVPACALWVLAACGPSGGGGADVAPDAVPADVPVDVPADVPPDVPPDFAFACPPTGAVVLDVPVLPRPVQARGWGAPVPAFPRPSTVALAGAGAPEAARVEALAVRWGLSVVASGADLTLRAHDTAAWDLLPAACPPSAPVSGESHVVRASWSADGRVVADLFAPGPAGRAWALETAVQLALWDPPAAAEVRVDDGPSQAVRGVVETFYGPPFEVDDRAGLMAEMARLKMNLFVYGSKLDPYLDWVDDYWRDEWPAEYMAFLSDMVDTAHRNGLQVGVQVKPLYDAVFSSEADRAAATARLLDLADLGFDLLGLSFDDTEKVMGPEDTLAFASYDEGVVAFSKAVLDAVRVQRPAVGLGWVPNDYWSDAPGAPVSLSLAGAALAPDVQIGWTGNQIVPATITAADADQAAAWMGRKPLLGDNYPVIDRGGPRVHLGPLTGRAPDLPARISGLLFNPSPDAWASLPALATCADYAWNAAAYDPESSLVSMSRFLAGASGAASLAVLARVDRADILAGAAAPELEAALDAWWAAFDAGADLDAPARALRDGFFVPFGTVPDGWESGGASAPLKDSLRPWAQQLGAYGTLGGEALDLLAARAAGQPPDAAALLAFRDGVAAARARKARPTGDAMDAFLARADSVLATPLP